MMSYKIIPRPDTMRSEEVKHEKLRSPFNKFKTSQNCGHLLLSNSGATANENVIFIWGKFSSFILICQW